MQTSRARIFEAINAERKYQDGKWGSSFDALNTLNDWAAFITIYLGRALRMKLSKAEVRSAMIKVAALCVALLERLDSEVGEGVAPRHYDDA